ncbi:HSPB1-associated protein 1 homolog isoform X2 [Chelmon rostratus]|uniref:HSPB1-associated protein 1 homolog isoform X2 n=1 Tax=Chelmon rostratus TaxID=109905 RepID=UPI001BE93B89|nr:HSPB1-associated protein 1 homolog isoform X2 [Chelmon rostratus]
MAAPDSIKPFSPEDIQKILHHLQQPAVFMNMTRDWPVLHWTAEHLSGCLGDKLVRFRLGRKEETNTPLFETQCSYVEAKLAHFLSWTRGQAGTDVGPFFEYPESEYWAYADYKYIATLFQDQPSMFEDVRWSEFGFEGRNGRESTLWIGTEGANTPCHLDSYGCNLVLQVQGRKRWHLFPPDDTVNLYPTRIPYEESSVFSQVDVLHADLRRFPAFQAVRAHVVTLQPGQVLYVPRHWWHYVESVDPITVSVNSWIELEGMPSHNENMQYLNLAVRASAQRHRGLRHSEPTQDQRDTRPVKRDSRGQIRKSRDLVSDCVAFSVPFGPHLTPVRCQQECWPEAGGVVTEGPEVSSDTAPRAKLASAVRLHQGKYECSPSLTPPCDGADGMSENSSEDYEEPIHTTITTNDLLDCLVHPDVIAHVTKLLLQRHTGNRSTTTPS